MKEETQNIRERERERGKEKETKKKNEKEPTRRKHANMIFDQSWLNRSWFPINLKYLCLSPLWELFNESEIFDHINSTFFPNLKHLRYEFKLKKSGNPYRCSTGFSNSLKNNDERFINNLSSLINNVYLQIRELEYENFLSNDSKRSEWNKYAFEILDIVADKLHSINQIDQEIFEDKYHYNCNYNKNEKNNENNTLVNSSVGHQFYNSSVAIIIIGKKNANDINRDMSYVVQNVNQLRGFLDTIGMLMLI